MYKQIINWLLGVESSTTANPWEDHSPVLTWRALQEREETSTIPNLNWLLALVTLTFVIPILAWSVPQQLPTVSVPVLKHRVLAGEMLTQEDFILKEMQQRYVNDRHIQHIEDAVGLEAIRPQRPGMPLYASHLQDVPAVRRNASVTLIFKAPGLFVTSSGKALESGQIGDSVRIKNTDSKQVISGVITAENRVHVQ